jgi:hypothetical protein
LNTLVSGATPPRTFDGYKTEAAYDRIEHSMMGHGPDVVRAKISNERAGHGDKVRKRDTISETERGNVPLTKEDYQNIPKFREEAITSGSVEFQPITEKKDFESIRYKVPQDDGSVIHMVYKIDPVEKKLSFWTMWKVQKV